MSPSDSYRILELSRDASQPDIRAAYHRLVRQWHPDKFYDDPDKQKIAERKIREIIGAYTHLSNSDVTQRNADVLSDDATDADRSEHARPRSHPDDVFYTNLEEAIRSGTSTFAGPPRDSRVDAWSSLQQAAPESQGTGRAACAYVGGDPRLKHLETGFLGLSTVVTWNSSGVRLSITGAPRVAYPADTIRSIRLTRRSPLAFLSEGKVRIQVQGPASFGKDGFLVILRFRDRYLAEFFASQLGNTFAVETRTDSGRFLQATLLIMLIFVLTGLGISIAVRRKQDSLAIESARLADRSLVPGYENGERDQSGASGGVVAPPAVTRKDADALAEAVAEVQRRGGSVIQINGRVVRVKLAGTRVDAYLLSCISGFEDLEELNLHATTITGEDFRHLSVISDLRILDLGSTRDASAGVGHLIGLTGLQVLRLSNTDISDSELKLLEQLSDLKELEVIGTQVTDVGIEDFKASRPHCIVVN